MIINEVAFVLSIITAAAATAEEEKEEEQGLCTYVYHLVGFHTM
jgi:hypothetical protein